MGKGFSAMSLDNPGGSCTGKDTGLSSGYKKSPPQLIKAWSQPRSVKMSLGGVMLRGVCAMAMPSPGSQVEGTDGLDMAWVKVLWGWSLAGGRVLLGC